MKLQKPLECFGCDLYGDGSGFSRPDGHDVLGVLALAEALGENEELDGLPLRPYAAAGSVFKRACRLAKAPDGSQLDREQFLMWNVIGCRPPDNRLENTSYEQRAINHCTTHRQRVINSWLENFHRNKEQHGLTQPVILAMGGIPWRTMTGVWDKKRTLTKERGYPFRSPNGAYIIVPTYHPAFVARQRKLIGVLRHDIEKAVLYAKQGWTKYPVNYTTHPTYVDIRALLERLRQDPTCIVSYDIETTMIDKGSRKVPDMKSFQVSLNPGEGMFLSWTDAEIEVIREIMGMVHTKIGFNNWSFDTPVLAHHGVPTGGNIIHDLMWMQHHYDPDLATEEKGKGSDSVSSLSSRAGLQFAASFWGMDFTWKHLSDSGSEDDRRFYGCADVDAPQRGWQVLPAKMKRLNIWEGYERHVRQMSIVLRNAAARGIPVNDIGRLALRQEIRLQAREVDIELQSTYPNELKNLDPKLGFANGPKVGEKIRAVHACGPAGAAEGLQFVGYEWLDDEAFLKAKEKLRTDDDGDDEEIDVIGIEPVWRPMELRTFTAVVKEKIDCLCVSYVPKVSAKTGKVLKATERKFDTFCKTCMGGSSKGKITINKQVTEERWVRVKPFKASKDQIIRYMQLRGHKIPYDPKAKKNTTRAKEIDRWHKKYKDIFYENILIARSLNKIDSTYCGGWEPWPDGRVHTEFGFAPATGQKNSRGPNVQNAPKHIRYQRLKKLNLPNRFRGLIKAPPGFRVAEIDYASFHALTLGFEARDASYMRLARIDVHTYMASHILHAKGLLKHPIDLNVSDADLKLALKELKGAIICNQKHLIVGQQAEVVANGLKAAFDRELDRSRLCPIGVEHAADPYIIVKEIRDQNAKPAILGKGFAMQAGRLYRENEEYFANEAEAKYVLDVYDATFPKIKRFQEQIVQKADDQKYLVSRSGYIRRFWDVYSFRWYPGNPRPLRSRGDDHEDAIAFLPANDAFGKIDDASLELEADGTNEQSNFINTIHDSLIYLLPDAGHLDSLSHICEVMRKPSTCLIDAEVAPDGLWCDVEASLSPVGGSWVECVPVKI